MVGHAEEGWVAHVFAFFIYILMYGADIFPFFIKRITFNNVLEKKSEIKTYYKIRLSLMSYPYFRS